MKTKSALICGITGQDGALLANFLLNRGYKVYGTSRNTCAKDHIGLKKLGIIDKVDILRLDLENYRNVYDVINHCEPSEIYLLAGQSSVGLSFEIPAETIRSFTLGALNILETCRSLSYEVRLYNAGSSECFGDTLGKPADETTKFQPQSPYGVAKASAHWLVNSYRQAYGIYACTGILFNHESPFRQERFVTQKIIQSAKRIKNGSKEKLMLGRLDILRDWGWAPEYVEAMWLMLQQKSPDDYVIATGSSHALRDFVETAFALSGLKWTEHTIICEDNFRPSEVVVSRGNPTKANNLLGWKSKKNFTQIIEAMLNYDPYKTKF